MKLKIALISILAVIAAGAWWTYSYCSDSYKGSDTWIYISRTTDAKALADTLQSRLGDYGSKVFRLWDATDGKISTARGAYLVESGDKAWALARRLKNGQQTPVKISFNNLRTVDELAARIAAQMDFSAADFIAACDSVLPHAGFRKAEYAAAFLPDTYEFYWSAGAEKVVTRLLDYRNRFWTDARRAQAAAIGLKPVDVATLASIVEEETARRDERPRVARLYLNRLDRGMLLQADPTVKWAVGDFSLRRILNEHLRVESPYNTYIHAGLPPGPIRIPERGTLEAVLDAPAHNYLYMCAKDDFSGYHNFAISLSDHMANARRYQAALNRLNIKR